MASQFDMIQRQILERQDKIFRGAFIQLSSMTVNNWPVDTGYSKASWIFATGAPSNKVATDFDKSSNPMDSIKSEVRDFKIGQAGYMTNATAHAVPLEFGHSAQAPNGAVRKYAAQWQQINDKMARAIR